MQEEKNKRSGKGKSILIILPFCLVVIFPWVDQYLKLLPEVIWEKRNETKTPVFDISSLDKFPKEAEEWLINYSNTRNYLLRTFVKLKRNLLGSQVFPVKVMEGENGWFYYGMGSQNYFQGEYRFDEYQLEYLKNELVNRVAWCDQMGVKYYMFIAPSKHSVYPENLPNELTDQHRSVRMEQLINLSKQEKGLNIVELKSTLVNHKSKHQLYYKTDHHWNKFGAYFGYVQMINELQKDFPNINSPVKLDAFLIDSLESKGWRLSEILGLQDQFSETDYLFNNVNSQVIKSDFQPTYDDKIGEYIGRFINPNQTKKVLLIHDSFADATMKFLPENFGEVVYFHDRYKYLLNEELIKKEKPDIVITFIYESNLGRLIPGYKDPLR